MARHPWQVAASVGGVLLLAALLAIIPAGRRPFWSSDEARVALLARDALEHGRWLVADLRDRQYLNKPQLTYWSVALSSMPFGRVTERSAAIPGVIASIAAVAGVIATGARLWGWKTGVVAGLVLVTSPLEFDMAHQVLPDMLLSAWLVWALYFLTRAARTGWALGPVVGFWLCLTAALLSKGPAALAGLAGAVVAVVFTDGVATLRRLRPVLGVALMLVIAGALWLVPYHVRSAGAFQGEVITGHYVTWYAVGSILGRLENLAVPLIVFLPWTVLLAAGPSWWRQSPDPARRRIVLWTVTLWVLIALSGHFRARYVLPVLPGFALLTAELVTAPVTNRAARALRLAALVCSLFAAGVAVVLSLPPLQPVIARLLMPEDRSYLPTAWWERTVMAIFVLGAAAALVAGVRRRAVSIGAVGLALGMAGLMMVLAFTYPVRYTRAFDIRPLVAAAAAGRPADAVVFGHPDLRLGYDIYLRRPVAELLTDAAVRQRLATDPQARVVMFASQWEAMAPSVGPGWRVLASATLRDRATVVIGKEGS